MQSKKIISKKILEEFMQKNELTGEVGFLMFIQDRRNLHYFYSFLNKHNYTLQLPSLKSSILFHGTQLALSTLKPHKSKGYGGELENSAYVYATNDPNYAIFLAILKLKNGSASVRGNTKETKLLVDLDFVNGPSTLENGYVHVLSSAGFKKTNNREYTISEQVDVLFTIPVTPAALTVPIYIQTEPWLSFI